MMARHKISAAEVADDLSSILNELGVIARPVHQQPQKPVDRPEGPPNTWRGVWYADGYIPH